MLCALLHQQLVALAARFHNDHLAAIGVDAHVALARAEQCTIDGVDAHGHLTGHAGQCHGAILAGQHNAVAAYTVHARGHNGENVAKSFPALGIFIGIDTRAGHIERFACLVGKGTSGGAATGGRRRCRAGHRVQARAALEAILFQLCQRAGQVYACQACAASEAVIAHHVYTLLKGKTC